MNSPEYQGLASTSAKYSDEFYRCIAEWFSGKRDEKKRTECSEIANSYRNALEAQIAFLRTREQTPQVQRALDITQGYLGLIERETQRVSMDS
jgi:hypothetical protein